MYLLRPAYDLPRCLAKHRCRKLEGSFGKGWCQGLPGRPRAPYSEWNRPQRKPKTLDITGPMQWKHPTSTHLQHFPSLVQHVTRTKCMKLSEIAWWQTMANRVITPRQTHLPFAVHARRPRPLAQSSIAVPPVLVMWMNLSSSVCCALIGFCNVLLLYNYISVEIIECAADKGVLVATMPKSCHQN